MSSYLRFLAGFYFLCTLPAWAGQTPVKAAEPTQPTTVTAPVAKKKHSYLKQLGGHLARVIDQGDPSLYLSGYAYHLRSSYGPELIRILNETAWGGGYGHTLTTKDGGTASLAITVFRDSLDDWQFNMGYMREWRWAPFHGQFTVGAGLSAMIITRPDFFDGRPFPAVLPQLSTGYKDATLIAMLVPPLPDGNPSPRPGRVVLNGDVVYFFARIKL
jgi:palmitoyl transferase